MRDADVAAPAKGEGTAKLALRGPRGTCGEGPHVAVARTVGNRGPAAGIETVGGHWTVHYRRLHVGLDFTGTQRLVVNPHFIDGPLEVLPVDAVPSDLQRIRGGHEGPRLGPAGDLHPVDVQTQGRPVVGDGQMRPRVYC